MVNGRTPYQLFDDLSEDEYAALKADIAVRGVLVPVEVDEDGTILDGHHRARACSELGITDYPRVVRRGLAEQEKRDHTRALQLLRRHLTTEQKRRVLAEQLRETPQRSDRAIGRLLGLDHKTVAAVRAELVGRGEIPHLSERVDALGRAQPAEKQPQPASVGPMTSEEARAATNEIHRLEAAIETGLQQLDALRRDPRWQDGTLQQQWRAEAPLTAGAAIAAVDALPDTAQPALLFALQLADAASTAGAPDA